ncbi:hypothetical protein [Shewanella sp. 10N.286.54.B9]|uniref:hypothetical protein n=1 Tax=Shewanella sp. 10N.286.54.B9 TaxID=3229719 RepID=UPI003553556B
MKKNSTFCRGRPTWTNACVGNNGSPSYVQYALGFSKAANLILDQVLECRGVKYNLDDMVYPVCFNMRHSVELRLKGAISELDVIAKMKGIKLTFDLSGSHDIGNIWSFFKLKSEQIDERYKIINSDIAPTILDIADVDSTGQTFRYPISNESQKHLADVALINFLVLKEKFSKLQEKLDELLYLNEYLIEEYSLGTFTKKLSRQQLFSLTSNLPELAQWQADSFKQKKLDLKKMHGLSSNELTKAINKIKSNYELMYQLNSPVPLKGVDEYNLIWFLDFWIEINPEIKERSRSAGVTKLDMDEMLKSIKRDRELKTKLWANLNGYITSESLAGLKALFYFAYDKKFSETYVNSYHNELKEALVLMKDGVDGAQESFMRLADKANFFDQLVMSLYFLHYNELAEELIDIYGVSDAFPWLDKARSRELFALPELAGY